MAGSSWLAPAPDPAGRSKPRPIRFAQDWQLTVHRARNTQATGPGTGGKPRFAQATAFAAAGEPPAIASVPKSRPANPEVVTAVGGRPAGGQATGGKGKQKKRDRRRMVPLGKKEALCEVIGSFPDRYRKSNGGPRKSSFFQVLVTPRLESFRGLVSPDFWRFSLDPSSGYNPSCAARDRHRKHGTYDGHQRR